MSHIEEVRMMEQGRMKRTEEQPSLAYIRIYIQLYLWHSIDMERQGRSGPLCPSKSRKTRGTTRSGTLNWGGRQKSDSCGDIWHFSNNRVITCTSTSIHSHRPSVSPFRYHIRVVLLMFRLVSSSRSWTFSSLRSPLLSPNPARFL